MVSLSRRAGPAAGLTLPFVQLQASQHSFFPRLLLQQKRRRAQSAGRDVGIDPILDPGARPRAMQWNCHSGMILLKLSPALPQQR
jgi:hypothetical protein